MTARRGRSAGGADADTGFGTDFSLRSIAVAAFGPSILFGLAEGAMLPVIPFAAQERGATLALAGFVASLLGIGSILSNIPAGILTTRVGERWAMVWAAALSAVGIVLCLVDAGHGGASLAVFSLGVLLVGAASSVFNLARQSFLTAAVPVHLRARAMSTLGGSMRVGAFVGPFLGAAAVSVLGTPGGFWVALVAAVAAGALALGVPELEERVAPPPPAAARDAGSAAAGAPSALPPTASTVTTMGMLRTHWQVFVTLGSGVFLLSAVRASRQVVIPLWAHHIGLDPTAASIVYGIAGAIDVAVFYPAGKVMDRRGRQWVAVPSMLLMATAMVLMPLTHAVVPFTAVSMLLGFGNGIGAGIVMTLGADASPTVGRPTFLALWREIADGGAGAGPLLLSGITALAGLAPAVVVSGALGYGAAAALWRWIPRRPRALSASPGRSAGSSSSA
ncbi:MFS transporter [Luteimicrobium subarcticum]|uniref:Putative MFS family arabinose efflux permease n=1 Tax=Luteimicrobium subarcticum TaxID=620910 RepID=A0A2M8WTA7_9MICO|nr:MFS transporter [Luteimicrobium subarcticum]PJI94191.1 putative MFS family arabinose efflux permease [Luteimicrobium subarcticum]